MRFLGATIDLLIFLTAISENLLRLSIEHQVAVLMGLKCLNLDPALISGSLLTTRLDAIGFLTFLSVISLALQLVSR